MASGPFYWPCVCHPETSCAGPSPALHSQFLPPRFNKPSDLALAMHGVKKLSSECRFKQLYKGVPHMPDNRRTWSEEDIVKLKSMAGKLPANEIAAELGRTRGATLVEASKLKISLRTRPHFMKSPFARAQREA